MSERSKHALAVEAAIAAREPFEVVASHLEAALAEPGDDEHMRDVATLAVSVALFYDRPEAELEQALHRKMAAFLPAIARAAGAAGSASPGLRTYLRLLLPLLEEGDTSLYPRTLADARAIVARWDAEQDESA